MPLCLSYMAEVDLMCKWGIQTDVVDCIPADYAAIAFFHVRQPNGGVYRGER